MGRILRLLPKPQGNQPCEIWTAFRSRVHDNKSPVTLKSPALLDQQHRATVNVIVDPMIQLCSGTVITVFPLVDLSILVHDFQELCQSPFIQRYDVLPNSSFSPMQTLFLGGMVQ
jgi:hypothetical protein